MNEVEKDTAKILADIARTHMPFGKYGPKSYPPYGVPIYDLPYEYLAWFTHKGGFPKGRLGELLAFVFQIKQDGGDAMFDPIRELRGGRRKLRPERRRNWTFGDADDTE